MEHNKQILLSGEKKKQLQSKHPQRFEEVTQKYQTSVV